MLLRPLVLLPLLLATPALAQELTPEQAAIKAHIAFLSSDGFKGRQPGTPEFDLAADYVAAQMLGAGLKPAGDGGTWFQKVPLVSYNAAEKGSFALTRGGRTAQLEWGKDFFNRALPVADVTVAGDVVFVGYGLTDAGQKLDDYAGLDVKGKVVAMLYGFPKGLPGDIGAHLGNTDNKVANAAAHGAAGVLLIEGPQRHALYSFEQSLPLWDSARMVALTPDGKPDLPGLGAPAVAMVSMAGADKLFAGSKLDWAKIAAADEKGGKMPKGPLGASIRATSKSALTNIASRNVVGVLEGSDPSLKAQYVVLSAHLDHVGIGPADESGDTIYNGAMDNAAGTASMLEVAKRFQRSGKRPRRSLIFLAVTAEEKGLIGSKYYADYPTVAKDAIVADVNLDMPILTYKLEDIVVQGGERSSIGPAVAAAAKAAGLGVVPDPHPEEMSFVRSDHYSFVEAGIPAISIDTGPGGAGEKAILEFIEKHYHQPSDDMRLPFDWNSAATFVTLNYNVARTLADADERPRWNKGDFFGLLFNGYGAK